MSNKIDSPMSSASPVSGLATRASANKLPVDAPESVKSATARVDGAVVDISRLELSDSPSFDAKRVESLRNEIASGRYAVNPERIANRLLAFEQELSK